MISCDLFFFKLKNNWQFYVPVLRKLHYEVMKDYISKAAYFLTKVFEGSQGGLSNSATDNSWLSFGAHLWPCSDNCVLWLTQDTLTPLPVQKITKQSILGSICLKAACLRES